MVDAGVSLREALRLAGCSRKMYYYKPREEERTRFVAPDPLIVERVERLILERPSYGARRIAAQLSRELDVPINRKRVQRVFRMLGYTEPAKTKSEIIRAKDRAPKASQPFELWQTDLTYLWCGGGRCVVLPSSMSSTSSRENGRDTSSLRRR